MADWPLAALPGCTTGDNYYDVRVYEHDADDQDIVPLVRALHAELCRRYPHAGNHIPACVRAGSVMRRWQYDLERSKS